MTIDKTFDRSSLCTTHMKLDVKGKKVVVKSIGRHRKDTRVIQDFTRVKVRINEEC